MVDEHYGEAIKNGILTYGSTWNLDNGTFVCIGLMGIEEEVGIDIQYLRTEYIHLFLEKVGR